MPSNVEIPLISRSPTKLHAQCVLIPRLFSKMLVGATPWTQTRKPRTVTTLATGRWTNDKDNSYHGEQKKKKEKEEVKKKRPLPLFDWQVYPKWSVQLLNVAPWPNDEGRRVPKKEPVLQCRLDQLQCSVAHRDAAIRLWYCCEKHFHSLDRSAMIGLITARTAQRRGLWSADHDLRLRYEPINHDMTAYQWFDVVCEI